MIETECDDGKADDQKGCNIDCSAVLPGWKCDNVGDVKGGKPANCTLAGSIGALGPI